MTIKWGESTGVYQPIEQEISTFIENNRSVLNESYSASDRLYSDVAIFMDYNAEKMLKEHLSIDPMNETGGVLVGDAYYCKKTDTHYTNIVGSIPALHTVGNRVHFKFTVECWQSILEAQKRDFNGLTILGWYHSHPGHGIFLSGTDLNTQRLSFNKIWQIAIVYDPLRHEIGYFYGADGKRTQPVYLNTEVNYRISTEALITDGESDRVGSDRETEGRSIEVSDLTGQKCCWTLHTFTIGETGIKCTDCQKVMTIAAWEEKHRCQCGSINTVPLIASNSTPVNNDSGQISSFFLALYKILVKLKL